MALDMRSYKKLRGQRHLVFPSTCERGKYSIAARVAAFGREAMRENRRHTRIKSVSGRGGSNIIFIIKQPRQGTSPTMAPAPPRHHQLPTKALPAPHGLSVPPKHLHFQGLSPPGHKSQPSHQPHRGTGTAGHTSVPTAPPSQSQELPPVYIEQGAKQGPSSQFAERAGSGLHAALQQQKINARAEWAKCTSTGARVGISL